METTLPTKKNFERYVSVQMSGNWNMFDPAARECSGLDKETWLAIMKNYDALAKKYPAVIERARQ